MTIAHKLSNLLEIDRTPDGRLALSKSWEFIFWLAMLGALLAGIDAVMGLLVGTADAATLNAPAEQPSFVLPPEQLYAAVIGALVPLGGYVLNYFAPWTSDRTKGLVQIALVTLAGALYAVLDAKLDLFTAQSLQLIGTTFLTAFLTHTTAWKTTGVSTALGGGRNAQDKSSSASADDHDHLNDREVA